MNNKLLSCIALLISSLSVGGCLHSYYEPVPLNYHGETSWIEDSSKNNYGNKIHLFVVNEIDGRQIKSNLIKNHNIFSGKFTTGHSGRRIKTHTQTFTVTGFVYYNSTNLFAAALHNNWMVSGKITFEPSPEKYYRLNGQLGPNQSVIWIEDYDGKIVSEKIRASHQ